MESEGTKWESEGTTLESDGTTFKSEVVTANMHVNQSEASFFFFGTEEGAQFTEGKSVSFSLQGTRKSNPLLDGQKNKGAVNEEGVDEDETDEETNYTRAKEYYRTSLEEKVIFR